MFTIHGLLSLPPLSKKIFEVIFDPEDNYFDEPALMPLIIYF
jgi:hypothetical protein